MARFRCNACSGEFDDVLTDGTRYFHACPPELFVRVLRGAARRVVPLTGVVPTDKFRVLRAGVELDVLTADLQADDQRIGDERRARANRRNENIDRVPRRRVRMPDGSERVITGPIPPGAEVLETLPQRQGAGRAPI